MENSREIASSNTLKVELTLDLDRLKYEMEQRAVELVLDDYFRASDIENWTEREKVRRQRLEKITNQVDWNKLPEEMQRGILKQFIEKLLKGNWIN